MNDRKKVSKRFARAYNWNQIKITVSYINVKKTLSLPGNDVVRMFFPWRIFDILSTLGVI